MEQSKRIINLGGEPVEAIMLDFSSITIPRYDEYELADGTVLKYRSTVADVFVIPDRLDENGQPFYVVNCATELKVKPGTAPPTPALEKPRKLHVAG
jgi:hypothetical protein